jgi:hypothetical protein
MYNNDEQEMGRTWLKTMDTENTTVPLLTGGGWRIEQRFDSMLLQSKFEWGI